jgi:L-ascorbate metabolism protein UlaG (beta-lactamase superfamily)
LDKYNYLIKDLGEFNYGGIKIKGIASFHDETQGSERGTNNIYTYTVNKIRICHLGDLGHLLTEEEIEAIGRVDVLMIPVGGFYTIGSENAAKVVGQLNPKVVIPMHYKTDALIDDFGPIEKVDNFISKMDGWKVEKLDSLELAKDGLMSSKEKRIVILPYK